MATVVRLSTFVEVAEEAVGGTDTRSLSARHEAVLSDGRRVVLLDGRGWSEAGPGRGSLADLERAARAVVGPDEPFGDTTPAEMEASHWGSLAEALQGEGVQADPASLAALPHDVAFGDLVLARTASEVVIRPWEASDRARVQELLRLLGPDAEVQAAEAPTYVAVVDGEVVGMVTVCVFTTLTGPKAFLDHLVVMRGGEAARRRPGPGRTCRRAGTSCRASRIDLTAGRAKEAGRALYESVGFRERDTAVFRLLL